MVLLSSSSSIDWLGLSPQQRRVPETQDPKRDEAHEHGEPERGEPTEDHGGGGDGARHATEGDHRLFKDLLGHAEAARDWYQRASERGGRMTLPL